MDSEQLTKELGFKVTVALGGLLEDHQRGLISNAEVKTGIKAIYDSVGGLVAQDVFELISKASDEFKHHKGFDVEFVKINNDIRCAVRICGNGALIAFKQAKVLKPAAYNDVEVDLEAKKIQKQWLENQLQGANKW